MVQPLWKRIGRFLRNKNQNYGVTQEFQFWVLLEVIEVSIVKRYLRPCVHCSTIQQPRCGNSLLSMER